MGATTHFDIGSSTYFCATKRHKKHITDQKSICAFVPLCFCASLWLELRFVGEREGKKRVLAGQVEFCANV